MSYYDDWNVISSRINSLARAAQLYAQMHATNSSDSYNAIGEIAKQCLEVLNEIIAFSETHKETLPGKVKSRIREFVDKRGGVIRAEDNQRAAKAGIIILSAFESEITSRLTTGEERIRARSERAFMHLQHTLYVDLAYRKRWHDAFDDIGETKCESLGGVHLLWHGIWAFKSHTPGERTDLVLQEPINDDPLERGLDGLVLTEWKVATDKNAEAQFRDAKGQLERYRRGVLGGVELTGFRYAIVVSLAPLKVTDIPTDTTVGEVRYRHINLAIELPSPSATPASRLPTV